MINDVNVMATTWKNLGYLCDIEVVIGLTCIMPLLEEVHVFIKFAQLKDSFVHDFVTFVKMYYANLYNMYVDLEKKYTQEGFKPFLDLHECSND
jgi:hypothetical protein